MADFLGGLLSGGGGLYDDLLTPQQQSQLSSRGLLSMAGAFADAAMPSRFPVPLGAAIGKAAAAMSGGRDEAALKLLQGQKLSQEVQTMKMTADLQKQFMDDLRKLPLDALIQRVHGGGGGAPTAAPAVPAGPAAPPTTAPLPAAPAAVPPAGGVPGDLGPAAGEYGAWSAPTGARLAPAGASAALPPLDSPPTAAERLEWAKTVGPGGPYLPLEDWVAKQRAGAPTGLLGPAPSLPPGDVPPPEPPLKASGLGAPDTVLPSGPGGLLATPALYGGGAGTPPFGPGGEPTVRLAASSGGGAPDAGRQARVDFWQSQGAPAHVAQGIADRIKAESGFNSSIMGDNNTSGGNYQHHADRLTRLKTFAAGQGQPWTDPNAQDQFAASEVKGGDAIAARHWPEILAAPTREAAATLWDKYFERSKYGPGAGGGAPDELVGTGRGVPGFTRAQYSGAAPGVSRAPAPGAPAAAGAPDGQGMNTLLLELAKRNAMAEILKLGNPYSSMLSVLQGSPAYQGQIEAAKREAGIPFIAREKTEERSVTEPSDIRIAQAKTAAEMAKDMALQGFMLDPDTNKVVPIPGYWDMMKGREDDKQRLQAEWQAKFKPVEATVLLPDGSKGTQKMTEYEFQQRQAAAAKRASMGAAPQPGDIVETQVYPPGYEKATEVMLTQRRPKAEAAVQSLNFNDTATRLLDAGVITGWGAQLRLDVAKAKALFGWNNEQIANTESFLSTQARQVAASLASGAFGSGSSITDDDRAYAARMTGADSNLDEASLRFLLRQNNTAARWEIDKYNADVKRHDPKGQLPILRVDEGPKAEAKPSANQPTVVGRSQLGGQPYVKWSDGKWRLEGELPGQENR